MSNFIEKYPVVVIGGVIAGGLLIRKYIHNRNIQAQNDAAHAEELASNPWLMQTGSSYDAYQYYKVTSANTRVVYGVGNETNLVSTDMLNNALRNQHDEIMQEVAFQVDSLRESFDDYWNDPYMQAVESAAGNNQMSYPTPTSGGHD